MKFIALATSFTFLLLTVSACESKSVKQNPTAFNRTSSKLASLPPEGEPGETTFSPDGFHVAVAIKKNGKDALMVDGALGPLYDVVASPVFNVGTAQVAYVATKNGKQTVVVAGKEGPLYDAVSKPQFAPDGRLVYAARQKDTWVIVAGAKKSAPFSAIMEPVPYLSPDGALLAHEFLDNNTRKVHLAVTDLNFTTSCKGKGYDSLIAIRGDFFPPHLVFSVVNGNKKAIVDYDFTIPGCMEKESIWYDDVTNFALSSDGRHLAFYALKGGKALLNLNGNEIQVPEMDMTLDVAVSTSGGFLFTGVRGDKVLTFIDSKDTGNRYDTVEHITMSPDGAHVAFVAGHGDKFQIVVDGHAGPDYEKVVTPRFSPDSKQVVYRVRNKGQRFVVAADLQGRTVKEFPHHEAIWELRFSPDAQYMGYGTKDGKELWWRVDRFDTAAKK